MASTEQQMLGAYQQGRKLLAARQQSVIDAERGRDRYREEAALAAAKRAADHVSERLGASHASEVALLRKEHEGERNVLAGRVESLQRLVEQQALQVATLAAQQERASAQLQDIATRAVEGAQRHGTPSSAPLLPPRFPAEGP